MCFFSLITVCLNPGEKLKKTLESALSQTCGDFELIVKDGCSTDDSLKECGELLADPRIRVLAQKDTGIYDAMNQAVAQAAGKYVFFLNCGDVLCEETVLENIKNRARVQETEILYGNILSEKTGALITPPPKITGFTCYRNVPCHQACFYSASLCREKPFETKYRIRGDYEHFLWCFYRAGANMRYVELAVAKYEGGGYSETKENLKRSKAEHKEITALYMSRAELFKYRALMALTLAPLRTRLAESRRFAGIYSRLLRMIYRR